MERKKSKHSISFPLEIDMNTFLGSKNGRENGASGNKESKMYELRGILLHKGASAYHGHYEAQVNDTEWALFTLVNRVRHLSNYSTGSWFQFNDEIVTDIKTLGDKIPLKKSQPGSSQIPDETEEK